MQNVRRVVSELLEPRRLFAVAFPGAEGFGANASGGRGGDVYHVTSLLDTNTNGTLRYGLSNAPAAGRTIVFDVGGTITLTSALKITKPNLTIAGQTAPGDGILIRNYGTEIQASNIILRHLRFRLGIEAAQEADTLGVTAGSNIILDHVSASWSVDETLSLSKTANNVTIQYSNITESLRNSIHSKGSHGYASLIRPDINASYSLHHNLYAHHDSRNPRPGTYNGAALTLDFRNNVVYDWGSQAGYNSADDGGSQNLNFVGNYYIAGPSTAVSKRGNAFDGDLLATNIYQSGNKIDANRNAAVDGANTGFGMFSGTYTQANSPATVPAMTTQTADEAYLTVRDQSGARPWNRDTVDARIRNELIGQTGTIIDAVTGFPGISGGLAPVDTDRDGMTDLYEQTRGLNPAVADNNLDSDGNGYTNLEEFLNGYAVRIDRDAPLAQASSLTLDTLPQILSVSFNESVTGSASTAAIQLLNTTTNQPVPASAYALSFVGNVARFAFAQPLDDGNYTLTVPASRVTDLAGNPLPGQVTSYFNFFRGDMNHDAIVNNADIAPFVSGLTDPAAFAAQYGYGPNLLGDVNRDGVFNNADIAPFVAKLTAGRAAGSSMRPQAFAPVVKPTSEPPSRMLSGLFGSDTADTLA